MQLLRVARPRAACTFRPKTTRGICVLSLTSRAVSHSRPLHPRPLHLARINSSAFSRSFNSTAASHSSFTLQVDSEPIPGSEDEAHDPNCICQDPNARLTKDTFMHLVDFTERLDPASSTDEDLTFLLQYLKASDIPEEEATCCAHTFGAFHAHTALNCLAKILHSPPSPHSVQRTVQAWHDIEEWIIYTFWGWIRCGMFIGRENEDRVMGYNGIVPFLGVISKIPELVALLVAKGSEDLVLWIVMFCWTIEADEWFVKEPRYTPLVTAAIPFADLSLAHMMAVAANPIPQDFELRPDNLSSLPGLYFLKMFETVRTALGRTPADTARTALTLLRGCGRGALGALQAHLGVLVTVGITPGTVDALLTQHSIRDVTRVLAELSQQPYDAASAPKMRECISGCFRHLMLHLSSMNGFSNVGMAVRTGILPALLRCGPWLEPGDLHLGYESAVNILHLVALYLIHPSVLRRFLVSARKIEEFGLVDSTNTLHELYLNLVHLAADRLAMVRPRDGTHIDLHVNCMNCGKHDTEAVFKDCSGCFLYSYCSEDCQKADWAKHEEECQSMQEARRKGDVLPMLPEDFAYLFQFAMALVNRHRAEIVRVWKEEQPARTPLVSFDFSEDPNGVMRVGAECLETLPGRTAETGMFVQELGTVIDATWYFSARWKEIMARPVHDEDALVCVYLPHGKYVMPKWMFIRIDEEYLEDEGTVLEKLIKTVEGGVEYGLSEPPVS